MSMQNWFPLFMEIMSNKVNASTELILKENEISGQGCSSVNQKISFYICFCLKLTYVTYIVDSLTCNSQPIALYLTAEQSLSKVLSSVECHSHFLLLRTVENIATPGGYFKC